MLWCHHRRSFYHNAILIRRCDKALVLALMFEHLVNDVLGAGQMPSGGAVYAEELLGSAEGAETVGKIEEKTGVQRKIVAEEIVEICRVGVVVIQFGKPDSRGGMDKKARSRGIGSGAGANIGFRPGDFFLCAQPPERQPASPEHRPTRKSSPEQW